VWIEDPRGATSAAAGGTINDGEWHHVVATFDSADVGTEVKIYVDGGAPVATGSFAGPLTPNTEPIGIASEVFGGVVAGNSGFPGLIDEVALYDVALSQARIQAHYDTVSEPEPPPPPQIPGTPYSDAVLADNPVSYWQFEDATVTDGDPAVDTQGNNPGTYQISGGSITQVPNPLVGIGGNAVEFFTDAGLGDNTGTAMAYVEVADDDTLDFTNAMSMEAWVNTTYNDTVGADFSARIMDKAFDIGYGLYMNEDGGAVQVWIEDPSGFTSAAAGGTINDGEWHHVVATFDSADVGTEVKIYVDGGAPVATGSFAGPLTPTTEPFGISSEVYVGVVDGFSGFPGIIDEAAVYNYALSPGRIQAHYNAAFTTQRSRLKLDVESSGNELVFTWTSQSGTLYNLLSDPGLATDPAGWPIWDGHQDIEATPPENTLTISRPVEPVRFFVVQAFPAPPVTIFTENFESGSGAWATGSEGDLGTLWQVGAPANVGPAAAHGGTNCFGTNIDADYTNDVVVWLRSPPIDLSGAVGATLNFSQYVDIEESFDSGQVRLLDAGDDSEIAVLQDNIDGETSNWEQISKALPAAALGNIKIEFRLITDDFNERAFAGWYIDDVEVTVP